MSYVSLFGLLGGGGELGSAAGCGGVVLTGDSVGLLPSIGVMLKGVRDSLVVSTAFTFISFISASILGCFGVLLLGIVPRMRDVLDCERNGQH